MVPDVGATTQDPIFAQSEGGPRVATHVRGTMIINSLTTLRGGDRLDDYFAKLPAEHHDDVNAVTVQSWVPMELAVVHYQAMGGVYLDAAEQLQNGRLAAERTQNPHVRTVVRTLSALRTLDMWDAMARFPGLVARSVRGGKTIVRRTGPKDARVEFTGFPFFQVGYIHHSMQGTCQAALEVMSQRIHVRQDPSFRSDSSMALLVSWV
jgi:hypothetical protein